MVWKIHRLEKKPNLIFLIVDYQHFAKYILE
jgi:hypothetical protein